MAFSQYLFHNITNHETLLGVLMTTVNAHPATLTRMTDLRLVFWTDKFHDPFGHDPRSAYVEQFWLSILGPTTTWFLRFCANELDGSANPALNLHEIARTLGISHRGGARSAMVRTVARACRFRVARPAGADTLAVRRRLPLLTHRQLQRLPHALQCRHEEYITSDAENDRVSDLRLRARNLAFALAQCGDSTDDIELQLGRWQFHPSIAADAVRWAWAQHHGSPVAPKHSA